MAKIISGKIVSGAVKAEVANETSELKNKGIVPGLAVVIVGNDPASRVYVNNKKKACAEVGFYSEEYALPEETTQEELLALVEKLNKNDQIDGILVQMPLPKHLDVEKVLLRIKPEKDVDAFHPLNVAKLWLKQPCVLPCTPKGIIKLLQFAGVEIAGKEAVVIGRSNIVGQPVAKLLMDENATVTIAHSRTKNLAEVARRADILVVAIGKERFVTADMIKPGAVVIDVGVNRDSRNGKLCGDVDYEEAQHVASAITPVPGGVGPMTITELMVNTVECFMRKKIEK